VDSTVVAADNAGEQDVSTVLCEVVSVSDGIVMGARLTAVSTLVALDANRELLSSDGNPEVVDPRKGSPEFIMSSGDDTVEGTYIEQTELIYCSSCIGNCSDSELRDQLASGICNGWLDTGTRAVEPEDETRDCSPACSSGDWWLNVGLSGTSNRGLCRY